MRTFLGSCRVTGHFEAPEITLRLRADDNGGVEVAVLCATVDGRRLVGGKLSGIGRQGAWEATYSSNVDTSSSDSTSVMERQDSAIVGGSVGLKEVLHTPYVCAVVGCAD